MELCVEACVRDFCIRSMQFAERTGDLPFSSFAFPTRQSAVACVLFSDLFQENLLIVDRTVDIVDQVESNGKLICRRR